MYVITISTKTLITIARVEMISDCVITENADQNKEDSNYYPAKNVVVIGRWTSFHFVHGAN